VLGVEPLSLNNHHHKQDKRAQAKRLDLSGSSGRRRVDRLTIGLAENTIVKNAARPSPVKWGGLKGSMQHWPVVYPPEFEIPRFVAAEY